MKFIWASLLYSPSRENPGEAKRSVRSTEQTAQERHKGGADQGNAAARHELLDTLRLCLCVIKK